MPVPVMIVIGAGAILLLFGLHFIYTQATSPHSDQPTVDATPNFTAPSTPQITATPSTAATDPKANDKASGRAADSTGGKLASNSASRNQANSADSSATPSANGTAAPTGSAKTAGAKAGSSKTGSGTTGASDDARPGGGRGKQSNPSVASNSGKPILQGRGGSATTPPADDEEESTDSTGGDPREEFFTKAGVPELRLFVTDPDLATLISAPAQLANGEPLTFVHAGLLEGKSKRYENIALKLDGGPGSFRPVNDRPCLTIQMDQFQKKLNFHGFTRFHLSNSVQDETLINECLASELFRAAKVPAPRVTHAHVWLNNRDLGLYVLKAGVDEAFLARNFGHGTGNLYAGGFVRDIDAPLEQELGRTRDNRSDLNALLQACRESDPNTRWQRLEALLDVEQFLSFMAMELMLGHRYGYTVSHNDYRIFFDSDSRKARFLPDGADRLFVETEDPIVDWPSAIVASAVMQNPQWRARFRERTKELLPLFSPADALLVRVDKLQTRVQLALRSLGDTVASVQSARFKQLRERIEERAEFLETAVEEPDPRPEPFDESGRLALDTWAWAPESPGTVLQLVSLNKVPRAYSITCASKETCTASWRCKTLLARGTYVLHAKVKVEKLTAPEEKGVATGAGIRLAGTAPTNFRKGTANWTPLELEFTVAEELRMVELILEARARKGQAWFDAESLYLTRADR
ncbi:MAG: CotH kinase family protein [Planctomycetes bacterium]|nr:CotH kinase family protein [Planctomycetota bacterium]